MATFLFENIVFGPVKSRRLGSSLGINLLPNNSKICNYNCIYCECGWTGEGLPQDNRFHPRIEVGNRLANKLEEMKVNNQVLDVITFAGNGEPTMHPEFETIIYDTIIIRDLHFPSARIAVLSNASMTARDNVFRALQKVDDNILKLDSAFEQTIQLMNQPKFRFNLLTLVNNLKRFKGDFILQTMFLKGKYKNVAFDNTSEKERKAWLGIVEDLSPKMVMLYTIARDTPHQELEKINIETLNSIASEVGKLGIKVQVSG